MPAPSFGSHAGTIHFNDVSGEFWNHFSAHFNHIYNVKTAFFAEEVHGEAHNVVAAGRCFYALSRNALVEVISRENLFCGTRERIEFAHQRIEPKAVVIGR